MMKNMITSPSFINTSNKCPTQIFKDSLKSSHQFTFKTAVKGMIKWNNSKNPLNKMLLWLLRISSLMIQTIKSWMSLSK